MRLHGCRHRTTSRHLSWAIILGLVLLVMVGHTSAQPVDIPATWGGDFWYRPRLTGDWGGLRDELGKKGVVLDIDLLQTLQGVASGGRTKSRPTGARPSIPSTSIRRSSASGRAGSYVSRA